MRIKRLKHCKKFVSFYKTTFGFREPFQILVDMTFCQFALTYKVNIQEQIPKYIEGESTLYTTSCILGEGKSLGPQLHGAVFICKQFKLRKCNHKKPVSAQECIRSMIGNDNSHHLFVASQDSELRDELRRIPGVPLLRIHYNALALEKPSKHTLSEATKIDTAKVAIHQDEKGRLDNLKKLKGITTTPTEETPQRKKKRKIKGVNPLAMKKKKKRTDGPVAGKSVQDGDKKRRKRKKIKISQHVFDELRKQQQQQQQQTT